jgi:Ca2+-binding RTX toxin-like protein
MTAISTEGYVGVAGRSEYFSTSNESGRGFVDGNDGNDAISAFNAADYLIGGLGRDMIFGLGGDDTIYGDQTWNDETTNVNQSLAAEADLLEGFAGSDTIYGGGGNNFINGGLDADLIYGGSGNEMLEGGEGNDRVYGGAGNDNLFGGTNTEANRATFLTNNIGSFSTTFNGTDDEPSTTNWSAADRAVVGLALTNTGVDYLEGGTGNDQINGGDGADTMIGGLGDETYFVDRAGDVVREYAGEGADLVVASASYTLGAGVAVETLRAAAGTKAINLSGNEFSNSVQGNAGANALSGFGGNDPLSRSSSPCSTTTLRSAPLILPSSKGRAPQTRGRRPLNFAPWRANRAPGAGKVAEGHAERKAERAALLRLAEHPARLLAAAFAVVHELRSRQVPECGQGRRSDRLRHPARRALRELRQVRLQTGFGMAAGSS